jgi:uncharacterized RDD family membrane protein YckC
MTELVIETPEGVTLRREIAGAGSRCAAGLVDASIWGAVTLLVFVLLLALFAMQGFAMWIATGVIVSLVTYQVSFGALWGGRTPGKVLLGIRVVDQQGFPASFQQHLLRGLFWPVEVLLFVPVSFGVILLAATPRSQRLGDLVAGTLVVRDQDRRVAAEPFARQSFAELPSHRLGLVPAHAARFSGEDLDYLRELLGRVGLDRRVRGQLFLRSARHYAAVLDVDLGLDLEPRGAYEVLREVYIFLREMHRGD